MAYYDNLKDFAGQPVTDFNTAGDWKGLDRAYRLREEYEDEIKIVDRLETLLSIPESQQLKALVIGAWSGAYEGGEAEAIVAKLVEIAPRLPELRSLFFGDLTSEECEISWIIQSDVSPLLRAYPKLEALCVRGGSGLSMTPGRHTSLKELVIQTGGLPRSVLREIFSCDFPALERLELFLGEESYGFDGSVGDLQPLLAGEIFPNLKSLGLMNSQIADDIAAVVVNSPIVDRIETLDLSQGNLSNEGANSLKALAGKENLKQLILSHHYISQDAIAELRNALTCEIVAENSQQPDDEWRPILHAE